MPVKLRAGANKRARDNGAVTAPDSSPLSARPTLHVAVLMRRVPVTGVAARWKPWHWALHDVVPPQPQHGDVPHQLYDNDDGQCWIFPGHTVELFRDDA